MVINSLGIMDDTTLAIVKKLSNVRLTNYHVIFLNVFASYKKSIIGYNHKNRN